MTLNTDPQRDSIFTNGPSDALDHATKKLPGEGFKRPWPPLANMGEAMRNKMNPLFGNAGDKF
jgi:4-hydroxy-3-polyprenylbenzoate decarboxylase